MTRKKILGSHVKRLLSGVSDHGRKHLTEVETDLMQTGILLEEAIEKLSFNFMAIHAAVAAQQDTIALLLDGGIPAEQQREKLLALQDEVGGYVNAAITSLQFQDMTSQLIARTIKRVNGLKGLLEELASHGDEIDPQQGEERKEIAKFLEEMNKSLNARSDALSGGLRRSVSQDNMGSGEIELF